MGRREGPGVPQSLVLVARSLLLAQEAAGVDLHTRNVRLLNYGVTARIPQRTEHIFTFQQHNIWNSVLKKKHG